MDTIKEIAKFIGIPLLIILICNFIGIQRDKEWEASYEAYITPTDYESLKIYCIADVNRNSRRGVVLEIHFPFGHSQFCDSPYDPDKSYYDWDRLDNYVYIISENDTYEAQIVLEEIATQDSYKQLDSLYWRDVGEAYASKIGDVLHIYFSGLSCPYGESIESDNLIRFYDYRDAEIMGFHICSWCQNNL